MERDERETRRAPSVTGPALRTLATGGLALLLTTACVVLAYRTQLAAPSVEAERQQFSTHFSFARTLSGIRRELNASPQSYSFLKDLNEVLTFHDKTPAQSLRSSAPRAAAPKNSHKWQKIGTNAWASGLEWKNVGHARPAGGEELTNDALSQALQRTNRFTEKEWDAFGISHLPMTAFIKVSGDYFQPVPLTAAAAHPSGNIYKPHFSGDGVPPSVAGGTKSGAFTGAYHSPKGCPLTIGPNTYANVFDPSQRPGEDPCEGGFTPGTRIRPDKTGQYGPGVPTAPTTDQPPTEQSSQLPPHLSSPPPSTPAPSPPCDSGERRDACGVCGGDNATCTGCDGIVNSPRKDFDVCGVCGGNGTSCTGCDGLVNSGKELDACGVCNGDGLSCAGCDGAPNSGKSIDNCGVCGGPGILPGTCDCMGNVLDQCNICGGAGIAAGKCDCAGSVADACHVCGGDAFDESACDADKVCLCHATGVVLGGRGSVGGADGKAAEAYTLICVRPEDLSIYQAQKDDMHIPHIIPAPPEGCPGAKTTDSVASAADAAGMDEQEAARGDEGGGKWENCEAIGGVKGNIGGRDGTAICCPAGCQQCGKEACVANNKNAKNREGLEWVKTNCCMARSDLDKCWQQDNDFPDALPCRCRTQQKCSRRAGQDSRSKADADDAAARQSKRDSVQQQLHHAAIQAMPPGPHAHTPTTQHQLTQNRIGIEDGEGQIGTNHLKMKIGDSVGVTTMTTPAKHFEKRDRVGGESSGNDEIERLFKSIYKVEDSIGRGSQTDASKNSAEAPSLQVFHKHLPEPSSNGVERAQDSSGDISSADIMRVENMAKIVRDGVGDVATVGRAGIAHEMDAGTRTQRKSLKAWQKQHAAAEHAVRDDMHDLWSQ